MVSRSGEAILLFESVCLGSTRLTGGQPIYPIHKTTLPHKSKLYKLDIEGRSSWRGHGKMSKGINRRN